MRFPIDPQAAAKREEPAPGIQRGRCRTKTYLSNGSIQKIIASELLTDWQIIHRMECQSGVRGVFDVLFWERDKLTHVQFAR